MSGKLDQSLDDILSSRPRGGRAGRRGGRRAPTAATKVATRAPVGGVQKSTKATKSSAKAAAPNGPAAGAGDSKIIVSNLVSHTQPAVVQIELMYSAFRCERAAN